MKNKKFLIIIPIIVIIVFASFILAHFLITKSIQKRMFTKIEDFSMLKPYEIGDADIIDTSDLSNYDILETYEKKVKYESKEYDVYAYIFASSMDCYHYFSGSFLTFPSDEYENWNYSLTLGVEYGNGQYCDFVIYLDNKLYRIIGEDKKGVINFLNWLNKDFETELK